MEEKSKGRSRPTPDARSIEKVAYKLEEALLNEDHCDLYYERKPWEVTLAARDSAVYVLRFLKFWFEMPQTVFFTAVGCLDQFLARMQVQERFLPCLTVSCFNVAAERHGFKINTSQLVILSQSKCSVKDMERMSTIITQKLNLGSCNQHRTVYDLLTVYLEVFDCIALQFKTTNLLGKIIKNKGFFTRLELLISDSTCASYRPSILALAFIQFEIEHFMAKEIASKQHYSMEMFYSLAVLIELQYLCEVTTKYYKSCSKAITGVMEEYNGRKKSRHCQKLAWRFSNSTLAISKYSQNYYSPLDVIDEEQL